MGFERFLTINTVIRKYQIETTRTDHLMADETDIHDADRVQRFSECIRRGCTDAKITWALSWQALHDQSSRYREIRDALRRQHQKYGDVITFIPGGYFANVYNTREQIDRDIAEAMTELARIYDGYRPRSLICGFLSAENIQHAREQHGIIAIQGNIWSQYHIDAQDADGTIAYPYYPSQEHFGKPAQNDDDLIDSINFDGWTVDLVAARIAEDFWKDGIRYCPRMGVGPLETIHTFGRKIGLQEMKHVTLAHFCDDNVKRNPFGWVTNTYEVGEATKNPQMLDAFSEWIEWIQETWPRVRCTTIEEMADYIRARYPNNRGLCYTLSQRGSGIGASFSDQEVTWYMNRRFRLGIVNQSQEERVFDYIDYTLPYLEPKSLGVRDWTLYGEINQKQGRPQDLPCLLSDFSRVNLLLEVDR